jgi:hypothetical protein
MTGPYVSQTLCTVTDSGDILIAFVYEHPGALAAVLCIERGTSVGWITRLYAAR